VKISRVTVMLLGCLACTAAGNPAEDTAATTQDDGTQDGSSLEDRVEEILDTTAEGPADAAAVRCLSSMDYDQVEVLDNLRLVFKGRGQKRWLNQLRIRCPGLRRHATLQFEMRSMRICEMDGFKSVDPGFGDRSGNCSLGKFEPISAEQEQMLKDALRAQRDAKRKSPE
jgi:hypothetical protein